MTTQDHRLARVARGRVSRRRLRAVNPVVEQSLDELTLLAPAAATEARQAAVMVAAVLGLDEPACARIGVGVAARALDEARGLPIGEIRRALGQATVEDVVVGIACHAVVRRRPSGEVRDLQEREMVERALYFVVNMARMQAEVDELNGVLLDERKAG